MSSPPLRILNILLADDDLEDCLLFKEALEELQLHTALTFVHDGEQLMQFLTKNSNQNFDVLFLDLNMPRKNGSTCLVEIKQNNKLKSLPVIIFSTCCDQSVADLLYKNGAHHYISKPGNFSELRKIIQEALLLVPERTSLQPLKENGCLEV
jgi:CheY-like chemotaxis protein